MLAVPAFRQSPSLCGPASLKMVLAYFGCSISEKKLARLAKSSIRLGTSAAGLKKAAVGLGFTVLIKDDASLNDIRRFVLKKKIPVIVNWFSVDDGHYSVVTHISRSRIFLQDPELGHVRSMALKTFKRVWFDFRGDYLKRAKDVRLRRMIVVSPKKSAAR